ncbi:MAG: GxxExxY protein [Ignavibacteria bacterium]|nr:GxxExxY protein [Ignavibacteria bacterium]
MSELKFEELTSRIIGFAIEVHSHLVPGLLESVYEECIAYELEIAESALNDKTNPNYLKEIILDKGYRIDLLVDEKVVIEIKSVEALNTVHEAQVLTLMKLAEIPVGLLLNFNVTSLRKGIRRFVM